MPFDVYLRKACESGKVIFPTKFCLQDSEVESNLQLLKRDVRSLESLKREKDAFEFAGQYMNDPVDVDSVEFKPDWFRVFDMTDELVHTLAGARTIISVDPAFRLKQTNDFSGIVVTKTTVDNFVYIMEAEQKKVNAAGLIEEIFRLVEIYKPLKVLIETVSAQVLLLDLLRDEMRKRDKFFNIEEVKTSTTETKAMKIRGLVPNYANGRIYHRRGLKELENQLLEFPRGTHDDIIDSLSMQIPSWKKALLSIARESESPYGSLNWWKKQTGTRQFTRIGSMFRDLVPARRI